MRGPRGQSPIRPPVPCILSKRGAWNQSTKPASRFSTRAKSWQPSLRQSPMMSNAPPTRSPRLIEFDDFPFELISALGERESWRKEIHRPIYHLHKWWAKRLGSVFRGILIGSVLSENNKLSDAFYSA